MYWTFRTVKIPKYIYQHAIYLVSQPQIRQNQVVSMIVTISDELKKILIIK